VAPDVRRMELEARIWPSLIPDHFKSRLKELREIKISGLGWLGE